MYKFLFISLFWFFTTKSLAQDENIIGPYLRISTNAAVTIFENSIPFNKLEFGGYLESTIDIPTSYGYRYFLQDRIGFKWGLALYFESISLSNSFSKLMLPVTVTFTHYFRDYQPSAFLKLGIGMSIPTPNVEGSPPWSWYFNGLSSNSEFGYRLQFLEKNFTIAFGFDIQQARSINKNLIFLGPSVAIKVIP